MNPLSMIISIIIFILIFMFLKILWKWFNEEELKADVQDRKDEALLKQKLASEIETEAITNDSVKENTERINNFLRKNK